MLAEKDNLQRAREEARAQLECIKTMVFRLRHIDECHATETNAPAELCNLDEQEIAEGIDIYPRPGETLTEQDRELYHGEDDARQRIEEDPLSVQVRSDWHEPGDQDPPQEYMILLCTGGPATRIIGDLDEHGEPESAKLQYQDWFTAWTVYPLTDDEEDYLLDYARCFYFGG